MGVDAFSSGGLEGKRQLGGSTLLPSGGESDEIALCSWRLTLVEWGVDAFSVRWVLEEKRQLGGPDPSFSCSCNSTKS